MKCCLKKPYWLFVAEYDNAVQLNHLHAHAPRFLLLEHIFTINLS